MEVFKSPLNKQSEATVDEWGTTDAAITIEANSSVVITIPFSRKYVAAPYVTYALECADAYFQLQHYVGAITATSFTVQIENTYSDARSVAVTYHAHYVSK